MEGLAIEQKLTILGGQDFDSFGFITAMSDPFLAASAYQNDDNGYSAVFKCNYIINTLLSIRALYIRSKENIIRIHFNQLFIHRIYQVAIVLDDQFP